MTFNPNEKVTADVVARLLEGEVPESQVLDYKSELPVRDDDVRHDFLEDVAAFANTAGGVILYGIDEKKGKDGKPSGIPQEVVGLGEANLDAEVRRLGAKLDALVKPRIPGVAFDQVPDAAGGPVLAVRVPRSWSSPHLIHKPGDNKWVCFYTRKDGYNQHLDWHEIRTATVANEGQRERIERFWHDRLGKIIANETPVSIEGKSRIVLHVVPIAAFGGEPVVDVAGTIRDDAHQLWPMRGGGHSTSTFDGVMTPNNLGQGRYGGYVLLFREGIIEAVDGDVVEVPMTESSDVPRYIASVAYEQDVIRRLPEYLRELQRHRRSTPYFVMLTVLGVRGAIMGVHRRYNPGGHMGRPIDREVLMCPPILVEDLEQPAHTILKPAFDAIWNAAGWPESLNYDDDGNWIGDRR